MHIDKSRIFCPHCDHEFNDDEMMSQKDDLFAIAPNEEYADLTCPICDKDFVVRGGYEPKYTTAFTSEEIEYA